MQDKNLNTSLLRDLPPPHLLTGTEMRSVLRAFFGRAYDEIVNGIGIAGLTIDSPQVLRQLFTSYSGAAVLGAGLTYGFVSAAFKGWSQSRRKIEERAAVIQQDLLFYQQEFDHYIQLLNLKNTSKAAEETEDKVLQKHVIESLLANWRETFQLQAPVIRWATQRYFIQALSIKINEFKTENNSLNALNTFNQTFASLMQVAREEEATFNAKKKQKTSEKVDKQKKAAKKADDYKDLIRDWNKTPDKWSIFRSSSGAFFDWSFLTFSVAGYQLIDLASSIGGMAADIVSLGHNPLAWIWLGSSVFAGGTAAIIKMFSKGKEKRKEREQETREILQASELVTQQLLKAHKKKLAHSKSEFKLAYNAKVESQILARLKNDYLEKFETFKKIKRAYKLILAVPHIGLRAQLQADLNQIIHEERLEALDEIKRFLDSDDYKNLLKEEYNKQTEKENKKSKFEFVSAKLRSVIGSVTGKSLDLFMTGLSMPGFTFNNFAKISHLFLTPTGWATLAVSTVIAIVGGGFKAASKYALKNQEEEAQQIADLIFCEQEYRRIKNLLSKSEQATKNDFKNLWIETNKIDDVKNCLQAQEKIIKAINTLMFEGKFNAHALSIIIENHRDEVLGIRARDFKNYKIKRDKKFTNNDYKNYADNWYKTSKNEKISALRSAAGAFFMRGSAMFCVAGLVVAKLAFGITAFAAFGFLLSHPVGWGILAAAVVVGCVAAGFKYYSKKKLAIAEREKDNTQELRYNQHEYKRLLRAIKSNTLKNDKIDALQDKWREINGVSQLGLRAKLQRDFLESVVKFKRDDIAWHEFNKNIEGINAYLNSDHHSAMKRSDQESARVLIENTSMARHSSSKIMNVLKSVVAPIEGEASNQPIVYSPVLVKSYAEKGKDKLVRVVPPLPASRLSLN